MNGVLIVDKPIGPTSHDVVARVRRALRTKRIGHTGTLDPLASGVLPLVIGAATRLASLLSGADKEYLAGIRLGLATRTYDATGLSGSPAAAPPGIAAHEVSGALERFRGTFAQVPPAFSAKKVNGRRAYDLARTDTPVALAPVSVTVHDLTLESYGKGLASVRVRAASGFYVRSLAHDLGVALGCGAHIETLRRIRSGTFGEEGAVPLEVIEREGLEAARRLVPIDDLLTAIPAVVLNDRGRRRAAHGNELGPADLADAVRLETDRSAATPTAADAPLRLLDQSGSLVAIAERTGHGLLHPVIVLV